MDAHNAHIATVTRGPVRRALITVKIAATEVARSPLLMMTKKFGFMSPILPTEIIRLVIRPDGFSRRRKKTVAQLGSQTTALCHIGHLLGTITPSEISFSRHCRSAAVKSSK